MIGHPMAKPSPRVRARAAGALYVLEGATSVLGQLVVPGLLVVAGDAAATAAKIGANQALFRLGLAFSLLAVAFHTAQTALLYDLFEPASRRIAQQFALFSLVAIALQAASSFFQLPALVILLDPRGHGGASPDLLQSLALVFLETRAHAFNVFLAFFGIRCVLIGYLAYRSTFVPRIVGVLMAVAGLGYLTFFWPPLVARLSPLNLALAAPGELSLVLWLLAIGVDEERWNAKAAASRAC